jgi:glycosyltransferase involved in cell wall biosynthesis
MNILLVTPWSLSETGGITTVVKSLASEFKKSGHRASVFSFHDKNTLSLVEIAEGVRVHGMYLRSPFSARAPLRAWITWLMFLPATLIQLLVFLRKQGISAVIIQYPLPEMFYFGILRYLCEWKLVVAYQGNDAHDLLLWSTGDRRLVRILLEAADAVVGVSETLIAKVHTSLPSIRLKRTYAVPNGAPLDIIERSQPLIPDPDMGGGFILTAGHLIHRKGMDLVIEALRISKSKGVSLKLVLAGDGPERDNLHILAAKSGVLDDVLFVGNQTHHQVLGLMKACEFFVLASRAEGMPLVLAEAMACGKAVVASRVDGVPDSP